MYTDNSYATESVWNGTGSGCSIYDAAPNWQLALSNWTQTHCGTKRAISDLAADADPNTGVAIYDSTPYAGSSGWWQVGGTSLASPIIASAYALAGGAPANTQAAAVLYQNFTGANIHDITLGSNGICTTIMCSAAVSYDGPTGLGSPNGIAGFSNTITPTPSSVPNPTLVPTSSPTLIPSPTPIGPDTTKPTVLITYPTNNSTVPRRTNITVTANASDNIGVTKVNFYHNNLLYCSRSTAPYTCVMSTPSFTNQTTTYKATAYDGAGNNASNTVTVRAQ
ncbi:hypothetical protein EPO05_07190 [Patescibacteria group bacterium]|nr:MAG: hypothetical protein EPO05_07190 [Patescibacteria group bacterium]